MGTCALSLAAALIDLADTSVSDFELVGYLDGLLDQSLGVIRGDAGGVILRTGAGDPALSVVAATSASVKELERAQVQVGEGPGIDSLAAGSPVTADDLTGETRWPAYRGLVVEAGFRSVAAFPLRLRDETIGAASVFFRATGQAAADDLRAVQALADMATIGILWARALHEAQELSAQLQSALYSRIVIEQAKGMLAQQAGVEIDAAFELLRRYSRNRSRRVRDTARDVLAGDLAADAIAADAVGTEKVA